MSIEGLGDPNLEQVSDSGQSPITWQVLLYVAAAAGVEPEISVPVTEEVLLGYEEATAGVVMIAGVEYKFNPWTLQQSHQDNDTEAYKNSLLLKCLTKNNIEHIIITTSGSNYQTLYIKYPETETPETPVE
jgi:hypothetical protein